MQNLTRRAALAAFPACGLAAIVPAEAAPVDAELLSLGTEFEALFAIEEAARIVGRETGALIEADGVSFITIAKHDPKSIADAIERLIAMLDAMEPDPDLEDSGDAEPWLGWSEGGPQRLDPRIAHDDREEACEDEGAHDGDAGVEDIGFDAEGRCHIPGGGSVCQATDALPATLREARA